MVGVDYVGSHVGADYVGYEADLGYLASVGANMSKIRILHPNVVRRLAANVRTRGAQRIDTKDFALARAMPAIFLGFDETVAASTASPATSEGTVPLRPTDLVVRASNAADFQISDMQVGRINCLAGATPIPAEAFNTSVVRPPISSPALPAGVPASLGLTNLTLGSSRFLAMYTALDLSEHPVSP